TFQHQGYGRIAMTTIIEQMSQTYGCKEIFISFVPDNTVARKLYESFGFQDTGTMFEDELVFKLTLAD
ncbi:MAG TPA: GNAT family N-acetyltransferase, partial [Phototrophicaceae bacterium]|nr:GNAT family N-acetyltransferase [Phototrophicaceae bacterium]